MKRSFFLIIIIVLSSCRSTQNMKLFQNMSDHELNKLAVKPLAYQIKPDDNLYVDIQTGNPEEDLLFSPSKSSTYGTQSNYGDVTGQYLNGFLVDEKGMILLPVYGEIFVADKTEEGAKAAIQQRVSEFYKKAYVKVKILTYKIMVLGEVKNPGVYRNYNKTISILEAISMANGISDYASVRQVLVIRSTPKGNKSYRLDLTKKEVMASEAFYLTPNDIVYVEPDKYKNLSLNSTIYSMGLSAITTVIVILTYLHSK